LPAFSTAGVPPSETVTVDLEDFVKKTIATCAIAAACAAIGCFNAAAAPTGPPPTATPPSLQPAHHTATAPQTMPPGHPGTGQSGPSAKTATITGTVLESLDASGYTYLRLKTADGERWAAVTQVKVAKGATVTVAIAMVADSFESKSLKRTFDHLVMGTLEGPAGAAPPPAPATSGNPHAGIPMPGSAAPADEAPIKVARAEGASGHTVAEVWAARATLKDGTISVRGKVVKYLPGIMGKNWIHLRDGSGTQAAGDNDITVTTSADTAVGHVVLVTGTVRVDKDFGAGYRYTVLIEDANLTK
jgi:hypothetical protein